MVQLVLIFNYFAGFDVWISILPSHCSVLLCHRGFIVENYVFAEVAEFVLIDASTYQTMTSLPTKRQYVVDCWMGWPEGVSVRSHKRIFIWCKICGTATELIHESRSCMRKSGWSNVVRSMCRMTLEGLILNFFAGRGIGTDVNCTAKATAIRWCSSAPQIRCRVNGGWIDQLVSCTNQSDGWQWLIGVLRGPLRSLGP